MTTLQTLSVTGRPRTARFTQESRNAEPGLPKGAVRVRYSCHLWNDTLQQRVAVYACYRNADSSSSIGTFFVNALEQFQN